MTDNFERELADARRRNQAVEARKSERALTLGFSVNNQGKMYVSGSATLDSDGWDFDMAKPEDLNLRIPPFTTVTLRTHATRPSDGEFVLHVRPEGEPESVYTIPAPADPIDVATIPSRPQSYMLYLCREADSDTDTAIGDLVIAILTSSTP